jgi:2'-5' RNA ligase
LSCCTTGSARRKRSAFSRGRLSPHVTLGRVREGHRVPAGGLEEFDAAYTRAPFTGGQLVLYESVLTTKGPRHEARLTLDLTA